MICRTRQLSDKLRQMKENHIFIIVLAFIYPYKNQFNKDHYERIELAVPKGMKSIIQKLARDKKMSVNSYIQSLIRQDQICVLFASCLRPTERIFRDFRKR